MKSTLLIVSMTILSTFLFTPVNAQNKKSNDFLKNLEYPELVVTPLASDRLRKEAKSERRKKWLNLAAIQLSGLMTFYAGTQAAGDYDSGLTDPEEIKDNKDKVDNASQLAQTVGGLWLLGATALSAFYTPYDTGYKKIKNLPRKTKQQKLVRERLAEEKLNAAGSLGRKLKYLSVASNLLANAMVIAEGQEDTQVSGAIAALTAFAPLIFESRWERISEVHESYKKKIYGPVSGLAPGKNGYIPTLGIAMTF